MIHGGTLDKGGRWVNSQALSQQLSLQPGKPINHRQYAQAPLLDICMVQSSQDWGGEGTGGNREVAGPFVLE